MCGVLVTVVTALVCGFMVSLVGWVGQDMAVVGQGKAGRGKAREGRQGTRWNGKLDRMDVFMCCSSICFSVVIIISSIDYKASITVPPGQLQTVTYNCVCGWFV